MKKKALIIQIAKLSFLNTRSSQQQLLSWHKSLTNTKLDSVIKSKTFSNYLLCNEGYLRLLMTYEIWDINMIFKDPCQ